jgi:hypothetical protein
MNGYVGTMLQVSMAPLTLAKVPPRLGGEIEPESRIQANRGFAATFARV